MHFKKTEWHIYYTLGTILGVLGRPFYLLYRAYKYVCCKIIPGGEHAWDKHMLWEAKVAENVQSILQEIEIDD